MKKHKNAQKANNCYKCGERISNNHLLVINYVNGKLELFHYDCLFGDHAVKETGVKDE